jgi:hypothetical protein
MLTILLGVKILSVLSHLVIWHGAAGREVGPISQFIVAYTLLISAFRLLLSVFCPLSSAPCLLSPTPRPPSLALFPNLVAPVPQTLCQSHLIASTCRLVKLKVLQILRQVTHGYVSLRKIMRITVVAAITQLAHQARRCVAQLHWYW